MLPAFKKMKKYAGILGTVEFIANEYYFGVLVQLIIGSVLVFIVSFDQAYMLLFQHP